MDNPISIKNFAEKYEIYSYSMMRKLFKENRLKTANKIWNTIIVDETVEYKNILDIKQNSKPGRNKKTS